MLKGIFKSLFKKAPSTLNYGVLLGQKLKIFKVKKVSKKSDSIDAYLVDLDYKKIVTDVSISPFYNNDELDTK